MKKFLLSLLLYFIIFPAFVYCQSGYKQAGLRTGYRSGIFFQITSDAGTAEIGYNALLGFSNNGIQVTGLRIFYENITTDFSPDLYFSWGYGGHVGFIVTDNVTVFGERYEFERQRFCPVFGADGWAAVEYRFKEVPLILGVNIKPFVELTIPAFVRIMPGDIGISVSYIF